MVERCDSGTSRCSHKGRLQLTGLTRLDPTTLTALRGHPNLLLPRPLPGDILKRE
ncbi:MAG: hypothetical protein ACKO26_19775 [Planctomycetota bacterium]